MKTWRERIVEARERGSFTSDDFRAWMWPQTCLVGEAVHNLFGRANDTFWMALNNHPAYCPMTGLQDGLSTAIRENDFDFVERRLDLIEDRALQLKREHYTTKENV